jgi:DNA-binding transcriptional LysR family regulator
MTTELDSDLLRTFVAIIDTGSFTKAAKAVHRTQSAVSMQMKRLEEVSGSTMFERDGRSVQLTRQGETLQQYARRILKMQAEALSMLKQEECSGLINLGIPDDYVDSFLPNILISFNRDFPLVEVNVVCRESRELQTLLGNNRIDLAIVSSQGSSTKPNERELKQEPAVWVTAKNHIAHEQTPIPMAMFDNDCIFRRWACDALDKVDRKYRIAYSSQSLAGIIAFVHAGLGISVMAETSVPRDLQILSVEEGFPKLPLVTLVLARSPANTSVITEQMEKHILQSFNIVA